MLNSTQTVRPPLQRYPNLPRANFPVSFIPKHNTYCTYFSACRKVGIQNWPYRKVHLLTACFDFDYASNNDLDVSRRCWSKAKSYPKMTKQIYCQIVIKIAKQYRQYWLGPSSRPPLSWRMTLCATYLRKEADAARPHVSSHLCSSSLPQRNRFCTASPPLLP